MIIVLSVVAIVLVIGIVYIYFRKKPHASKKYIVSFTEKSNSTPETEATIETGIDPGNEPGNETGNESKSEPGNKPGNESSDEPGNKPGNKSGIEPSNSQ